MANVRSSSSAAAAAEKSFLCACTALLLCSCSLFQSGSGEPEPKDPVSLERSHFRKQTNTLVCLIADSGKPYAHPDPVTGEWTGIEPDLIRSLAEQLKMQVIFIQLPVRALPSALRNGRGDIAAGKLDTDLIRSLELTDTVRYLTAGNEKNLALAIRSGDRKWFQTLTRAAKNIDLKKITEDADNTIKNASVQLLKPEEKEISISIDMGKDKPPKK